jgi:hypothetical protein
MAPMEYLWAWGTLIHEKNLSSKISCQTPFKQETPAGQGTTSTAKPPATAGSVGKSYKNEARNMAVYMSRDKKIWWP